LTLLATIIDVGDISLLSANAIVLNKKPSIQESKTTKTDFIFGRNMD
jgi:hypothetical protein